MIFNPAGGWKLLVIQSEVEIVRVFFFTFSRESLCGLMTMNLGLSSWDTLLRDVSSPATHKANCYWVISILVLRWGSEETGVSWFGVLLLFCNGHALCGEENVFEEQKPKGQGKDIRSHSLFSAVFWNSNSVTCQVWFLGKPSSWLDPSGAKGKAEKNHFAVSLKSIPGGVPRGSNWSRLGSMSPLFTCVYTTHGWMWQPWSLEQAYGGSFKSA